MTFLDLVKLVKHFWLPAIAASLAGAVLVFAVSFALVAPKHEATATLACMDPSANVTSDMMISTMTPIAKRVAQSVPYNVAVTVTGPKAGATAAEARILTISAEGKNGADCVAAVNMVAQETASQAAAIFDALEDNQLSKRESARALLEKATGDGAQTEALLEAIIIDREYDHIDFVVSEATDAASSGSSPLKLAIIAFFGVLVLAIIVMIAFDSVRRPIKSREDIESSFDLPVLSWPCSADEGEMLWGNICFQSSVPPSLISIVPLSTGNAAGLAERLRDAIGKSKREATVEVLDDLDSNRPEVDGSDMIRVVACQPLNRSVASAYCARESDAVILCARMWHDGTDDVDAALSELKVAEVRPLGIALLSNKQ